MDRTILDRIASHLRDGGNGHQLEDRRFKFVDAVRMLARRLGTREGCRMYEVLAQDFPAVAQNLGFQDFEDVSNPDDLPDAIEALLKDIRRDKHQRLVPAFFHWMWLRDAAHATLFLADVGFDFDRWQTALEGSADHSATIAGTQATSPYRLERVLATARARIILIAQNHWHMVSDQRAGDYRYWPLFRDALCRGVDIDIVAMHPLIGPLGEERTADIWDKWPDAAALWSAHSSAPLFVRQLDSFWSAMEDWDRLYREITETENSPIGNLRMFGAYFTPLTMTIVDPDLADATVLISPRTPDPKATLRPLFVVRKQNDPDAFAYYYADVAHALLDHHWVKFFG